MPHLQRVRLPRAQPGQLHVPAAVQRRLVSFHQADAHRGDLRTGGDRILLGGLPQAPVDPARHTEHRRDRHPSRARPDPAPFARQAGRHLPAVPGLAVLLYLADEPDGAHPSPPVPGHVPDRLRLAARVHRLLSLPLPGVQAPGVPGYIKNMIPWDVPKPILIILIPIELLRFFVVQPFTLGVRLFANMFAGHLLLLIFILATWYLASVGIGLLFAAGSFAMVFFVFGLELLIDLLQAFIFTTLTAVYIASSLESAH